jgi:beta-ribofuranosylaminobenzene 5'-phosphate synthase
MAITVRAYPRVHVGLIDLAGATPRRYGGAGFILDWSPVEVSVSRSRQLLLSSKLLDRRGQTDVAAAIARLGQVRPSNPAKIVIRHIPPQHVGLGTKTAVTLAVLQGCQLFSRLDICKNELQVLSGRGGASGVGIHGFFEGGFIVDAGHKADPGAAWVPSSFRTQFCIPPLIVRIKIPDKWRFFLFLPGGYRYSGARELRFFRQNTPIPRNEAKESLSLIHHGVVPSVLGDDVLTLKQALSDLHTCGFKRREVDGQPKSVKSFMECLRRVPECAVGMSSMGPLVYAIVRDPSKDLAADLEKVAARSRVRLLGVCGGRNQGFEVL